MLYQSLFPCITEDFVPLRLPVLQPANSHTHRRTFGLFPLRAIRDRAALNNPALASVWMYTHFRLSGSHTREVVTAGLALQDKVSVLERLRRPALRSLPLPVAMLPILTSTWRCHSIFILALLAGEGGQESIFGYLLPFGPQPVTGKSVTPSPQNESTSPQPHGGGSLSPGLGPVFLLVLAPRQFPPRRRDLWRRDVRAPPRPEYSPSLAPRFHPLFPADQFLCPPGPASLSKLLRGLGSHHSAGLASSS